MERTIRNSVMPVKKAVPLVTLGKSVSTSTCWDVRHYMLTSTEYKISQMDAACNFLSMITYAALMSTEVQH